MKKFISILLLTAFVSLYEAKSFAMEGSLYEFLKSNKEINATYKYPSLKISTPAIDKKQLASHTPIVIRNNHEINTQNVISGDSIDFFVVNDIKDNSGNVLIKSGTPVEANITFAKPGRIGKSGKLTISDLHTTAVDGSFIPLSSSISAQPDDKMVLSVVLSVCVCPLFLLMKGEDAVLPAGTTKTLYTVSDTYIKPAVL